MTANPTPIPPRARRSAASVLRFPRHALTLAALAAIAGSALQPPAMAPATAPVASVRAASPLVAVAPAAQVHPAADADDDGGADDDAGADPGAGPDQGSDGDAQADLEPQLEPIPVVEAQEPGLIEVSQRRGIAQRPLDDRQLRAQLHWLRVRVGSRELATLDVPSRLALARSAAQRAGLNAVGLDFRDLYGVISAETSWLPRTGRGRNGVASHGLAQLEPATAHALGVRNPDDAVEAVHAAARLLREAAVWSAHRIAGLRLDAAERARRLRAGVSVYYNLSTRARERWTGDDRHLPVETLRHIRNVRAGALEAEALQSGRRGVDVQALAAVAPAPEAHPQERAAARGRAPMRHAALARAEPPRPLGTIAWSSRPGEQNLVWSNGRVTRSTDPVSGHARVHWTSGPGAG